MATLPNFSDLQQLVKRRKSLALAAAVGVAGCGLMAPQQAHSPPPPPAGPSPAADNMVQSYTSDIEKALDNIDRKRLSLARQAAQPQTGAPVEVAKVETVKTLEAQPAVTDDVLPQKSTAPQAAAPAALPQLGLSVGLPIPEPVKDTRAAAPAVLTLTPTTPAPDSGNAPVAAVAPVPATPATLPTLQMAASYEPLDAPPRGVDDAAPLTSVLLASPASALPAPKAQPAVDVTAAADTAATITPTAAPAAAMSAMLAMNNANTPAAAGQTAAAAAEPTVDDALAILRKSISEHPTLNTALAMALLDGKSSDEIAKSLSDPDQKVLADLTAALDSMKTTATTGSLEKRAAPIVNAAKHWQADADLALPRLVLASRVDSYGVYTSVEPIFEQGKRHTVIIYCEVNNFGSKKSDDGWYNTKLSQQESLITEDKLLVWRPNAEEVEDRSLNQRHDFYLVKKLTLPETLAAGKYTLRMDVTDATTGKRAIQSMDIQLVNK